MGVFFYLKLPNNNTSSCLDAAKEARSRERQSPGPAVLDSSSQLDVSTVCSARETMLPVLELVPQCTWLLRSLSWLATLPVTTRRPGSSPVTFSWPSVMTCSDHSECQAGLSCVYGHCGDGRYLAALGDMQCQDDSLCRELLLGDLCCYDVSTPPHSWQGEGGTHNLTRKCCQNDYDAPVIPPLDSVDQSHLSMIDKVLSKLEEFEITKLYCLVFSNEMRNKMPSCNSSSSSSGSATTTSITGIVATLALIVISL